MEYLVQRIEYPSIEKVPTLSSRLNWLARYFPDETEAMIEQGHLTKTRLGRLKRGTVSEVRLEDIATLAITYGVSIEWLMWGLGKPKFDWHDENGRLVDPRGITTNYVDPRKGKKISLVR